MRIGSGGHSGLRKPGMAAQAVRCPARISPRATGVSGSGAFRVPNTIAPVWDPASGG